MALDAATIQAGFDRWNATGERFAVRGHLLEQPDIDKLVGTHDDLAWVDFSSAQFGDGDVNFGRAQFGDRNVNFYGARFGNGNVNFYGARFGDGDVNFSGARFGNGNVYFIGAQFGDGDVDFYEARFGNGNVYFYEARFGDGDVNFSEAQFGNGDVYFSWAQFGNGRLDFRDAVLDKSAVSFRGVSLETPLELAAKSVHLNSATLNSGGLIQIHDEISLEGTRIAYPTTITKTETTSGEQRSEKVDETPRVASMDRAWITQPLTIGAGVSLADCTFAGTNGLEQLRPEGRCFSRDGSKREEIAGEQPTFDWRDGYASRIAQERWLLEETADSHSARAAQYRQIRVGLEKAGNLPGANDFYFGELENRRRAAGGVGWPRRPDEWLTLSAYRWTSGYGQNAALAFGWFVAVIVFGVIGFRSGCGLTIDDVPLGLGETAIYTLRTATSFFRPPDADDLSLWHQIVQLIVRFLGPIFLALVFFAVRNRVRR